MEQAKQTSDEYAKGLNEPAKVHEVVQLVERGVAPVRAGVKFSVVVSLVALLLSVAAAWLAAAR